MILLKSSTSRTTAASVNLVSRRHTTLIAQSKISTRTIHDEGQKLSALKEDLEESTGAELSERDFVPGWNETLATASEAYVKADAVKATPKDLQEETAKRFKMGVKDNIVVTHHKEAEDAVYREHKETHDTSK